MSLDNLDLNDLIPSSIKSDIEVQNCVTTLNNEFNLIKDAIDNINIYSAIDTLPMEIVQLLAWQFNVNSEAKGWLLTSTDAEKRELVKNSIRLHRTKGTKYAIEEVLRIVGFEGEIQEWYDYGGHPYHFKIKITSYKGLDEGILRRLNGLIREYKNARSFLEDIAFSSAVKGDVPKIGTTYQTVGKTSLFPSFENNLTVSLFAKTGATYQTIGKTSLIPNFENDLKISYTMKIGTTYQTVGKIELLPNFENNLIISSSVKSAATYHSLGRVDLLPL